MCGIAGIFSRKRVVSDAQLDAMVDSLTHRGPDDRGVFLDNNFGFGMRRLSIIDVSGGRQPIFNEDESLGIVLNGEIYNYRELRKGLIANGHQFRTESDTEVILHLFEEKGIEAFAMLRGMFAVAIWDVRRRRLTLARDGFGIKPLLYFHNLEGFFFSSELRSFFCIPSFEKRVNLQALSMQFSVLFTNPQDSVLDSVHQIVPGTAVTIEENGVAKVQHFFNLKIPQTSSLPREERKNLVRNTIRDSVAAHLVSDVPVGAYLSGGVDSSYLLASMRELQSGPLHTFSVGYGEGGESFDETVYARAVAKTFQSTHHEVIIGAPQYLDAFQTVARRLDHPFANASVVSNFLLAERASKYVKVALSGLGADEITGGYSRYQAIRLFEKFPILGSILDTRGLHTLIGMLPDSTRSGNFQDRLKRVMGNGKLSLGRRYASFMQKLSTETVSGLFLPELRLNARSAAVSDWFTTLFSTPSLGSTLQRAAYVDLISYLVEDLLALSDRTSSAHGLEVRVPFVDHAVINTLLSLPDEDRISRGTTKSLFKEIVAERVPADIVYRAKKGFSVPLPGWLRGPMKSFMLETLSESAVKKLGIFHYPSVRSLIQAHLSGQRNHDDQIFALMSFVLWSEAHGISEVSLTTANAPIALAA